MVAVRLPEPAIPRELLLLKGLSQTHSPFYIAVTDSAGNTAGRSTTAIEHGTQSAMTVVGRPAQKLSLE